MPVLQLKVTKDALVVSLKYGAGAEPHAIATLAELGSEIRSLSQFEALPEGIVTLTYARHYRKTVAAGSSHNPADVGAQTIAERVTESWAEGTQGSDHIYSTHNSVVWPGPAVATDDAVTSADAGQAAVGSWWYQDVTPIVQSWVDGEADNGIRVRALTAKDLIWAARETADPADAQYLEISYSTNTPPNAPTGLTPTGGAVVNTLTPTFQGTLSDPNTGDTLSGIEVKVFANDGTTLIWDSGVLTSSGTVFSKVYSGPALTGGLTYKWQARTKDAAGAWGPYSALQSFVPNATPTAPTLALQESPTTALRTLTPTFLVTHNDSDPGDTKAFKYHIILELSDGTAVWDSGDVTLGTAVATVSVAYAGPALNWQTGYRWRARTQDSHGAWSPYSANSTFTTATTSVPTGLAPTASTVVGSITPSLTGSRGNANDSLASAQVQLYDSTGATLIWDSGTFTSGVTSSGFSKAYAGTTLAFSTTYKWRVRATGSTGGTSAWSALQAFITPSAADISLTSPVGSPITSLTPNMVWSRTNSFNAYQIQVRRKSDAVTLWDTNTVTHASATTKTIAYAGTALAWNVEYEWRVRVSSDSGATWGNGYTGWTSFTTDAAGAPTLTSPASNAWITSTSPTFTGSTVSAESATAVHIIVYASDQTTVVWDSGDLSQAGSTTFSKAYAGTALTKGQDYYWQARYTKSTGPTGPYSTLQKFHVNADPSAPTNVYPTPGLVIADTLTPTLKATWVDSDTTTWGDFPTLLEFEVRLNSDGTLITTVSTSTALVTSENTKVYTGPALSYNVDYKVRARFTDSKGAVGAWSSYSTFRLSQSPTLTITSPSNLGTIASPTVVTTWTLATSGSKTQLKYQLKVTRISNDTVVYDSGLVTSAALTHTVPAGHLQNGNDYRFDLIAYDTDLLTNSKSVTVTASWSAPAAITGLSASVSDLSVVTLDWDLVAHTNFVYFQIYRKLEGKDWEPYDTVTDPNATSYQDFYAGQGLTYRYKVNWFKSVTGDDDLESQDSNDAIATIQTDDWVVIGVDLSDANSFTLPVDTEDHTNPIQREVFEPLGSNRKITVRGYALGAEGKLSLVWPSEEREDGKSRLKYMRETAGPHILKSPFGDVWLVDFDGNDGKYGAGGSLTANIEWTEVA